MGTFRVSCKVENHLDRSKGATVPSALVDTESEYTWVPEKILKKVGVSIEKKDLPFTMATASRLLATSVSLLFGSTTTLPSTR